MSKSILSTYYMKYLKIVPLFLILQLFSLLALAQESTFTIKGVVLDANNQSVSLAEADIFTEANQQKGSVYVETDGSFEFTEMAPGKYRINIHAYGYNDLNVNVTVVDQNVQIAKQILNKAVVDELKTVVISEDRIAVQQKDDTTQFDARAFKTNPDASAEDLLRKMPGMDLSSGTPKTQGENITKVLVDGKPFFGEDPTAALKNLPAEVIDKIQVYDERSEQSQFSGFDDGNTTKTLNITTRKDRKEGVFGKVYVGAGTDIGEDNSNRAFRYSNGGTVNYFKGSRRITLMGLNNNVNQQNFSSQDLIGSGSGAAGGGGMRGGGAGGRGGSGGGMSSMGGSNQGINRTNGIGLNYSDLWSPKVEVSGSYMFNNTKNNTDQEINRIFSLERQLGQTYQQFSNTESININHRLNGRIKYTIDSFNTLLIMPNVSYQKNNSLSTSDATTYLNNGFLNSSYNKNDRESEALNASLRMLYSHKFKKAGRSTSLWLDGGYNYNNSINNLYALNKYIEFINNDTLDQMAYNDKDGYNLSASLSYTEPLSKRSSIQARYKYGYNFNNSDRQTFSRNPLDNEYNLLNTELSNVYATAYITNGAELSYRFAEKKYDFNVGLEYQNALLTGERTMPVAGDISRSFNNILPSARFKYTFSKTDNMRLFFRSYSRNPSVDQLQDVINNTNPLQLTSGNSNLVQSVNYDLFGMYNRANIKRNSTFFAMLRSNIVDNYIGNSTIVAEQDGTYDNIYLAQGAQYSKPINIDGYKSFNGFLTYGQLVSPIKTNVNVNLSAGYTITPGLINYIKNEAKTTNIGIGLVLSSNISENIDYTLSSTANINNVVNTINANANNKYYNQVSRFSINYIFWKGFVFNTELNHQYYSGLSRDFNQNFLLWNASLGKKVFKNQGEFKIQVFDLLGQNTAISRTNNELYVQDTRTNVLQRYFLGTFVWNLRYFKGGASEKDAESKENFRPMPGGMPAGGAPPMGIPGH